MFRPCLRSCCAATTVQRLRSVGAVAAVAIAAVVPAGCERTGAVPPGPKPLRVHPVFLSAITGRSAARPAVEVEIRDASEGFFTDAELYLSVQRDRAPDARVLLPINVGDFAGCRLRFVQLPFEVEPGDNLIFELLDDDQLSSDDERAILAVCRASGFCVVLAGHVYGPPAASLIDPAFGADVAEVLGESVLAGIRDQTFENFGRETFVVPPVLPSHPHEANRLALLDDAHRARVTVKVYGPASPLDFQDARGPRS